MLQVSKLAEDHDVFMRRHAIRVETQVVDRAMGLLQVGLGEGLATVGHTGLMHLMLQRR